MTEFTANDIHDLLVSLSRIADATESIQTHVAILTDLAQEPDKEDTPLVRALEALHDVLDASTDESGTLLVRGFEPPLVDRD